QVHAAQSSRHAEASDPEEPGSDPQLTGQCNYFEAGPIEKNEADVRHVAITGSWASEPAMHGASYALIQLPPGHPGTRLRRLARLNRRQERAMPTGDPQTSVLGRAQKIR